MLLMLKSLNKPGTYSCIKFKALVQNFYYGSTGILELAQNRLNTSENAFTKEA